MKNKPALLIFFVSLGRLILMAQKNIKSKNCIPCEQLIHLGLPDVTILEAKPLLKDSIGGQAIKVPFCHILGRISKEINFELLLPDQWNARFLMSGGGAFVGNFQNDYRYQVNAGYATAGTDAGHQGIILVIF